MTAVPGCPATHPRCQHTRASDASNYGCHCEPARRDRESRRKKRHLLRSHLMDNTGARRRLQALMAIGYSQTELAAALDRHPASGSLGPLLWKTPAPQITRPLHDRIVRVYDQLWDKPSTGPRADLVQRRAAARGWAPPLFWDDDLIDDPSYDGHAAYAADLAEAQQPTRAVARREFTELVNELTRKGWSAARIAEHTGRPTRAVTRARHELREQQHRIAA